MSPQTESGFGAWLDQRVGWRKLLHEGLDEPIPGGARWAYVFGSGLLFILVNQILTGVALSLYYVPSADHAHTTVLFIQKEVTAGAFLRSLHSWGSSAMIVVLLLHLGQTYLYGAYKSKRELLWLAGCCLFLLVLGMSFTGYLLPWDQKAYAATAVATNILSEVPLVGSSLKALLRGGTELGTVTLSRFFMLHVFVIPGLMFGGIALHVFFFRKAGAAGPPVPEETRRALPVQPFFPGQVFKDFLFGLLLLGVLSLLAIRWPTEIGPKANPADPTFIPRPEWYYVPVFEWLKFWHGPASVIGIVVAPAVLFLTLFALPFIDRTPERRPLRRPIAVGGLILVFGGLVFLGARSRADDQRDPAVRAKLAAQEAAERLHTDEPFAPEESENVCAARKRSLTPQESKGALLFVSESCSGCHGSSGNGGPGLFRLANFSQQTPSDLADLLRKPNADMLSGGMEATALTDGDLDALVAYLRTGPAGKSEQ